MRLQKERLEGAEEGGTLGVENENPSGGTGKGGGGGGAALPSDESLRASGWGVERSCSGSSGSTMWPGATAAGGVWARDAALPCGTGELTFSFSTPASLPRLMRRAASEPRAFIIRLRRLVGVRNWLLGARLSGAVSIP